MKPSMKVGAPIDARVPFIRALHDLDAAWQTSVSGPRQRAVEAAGKALGDALREGPRVVAVRTLPTSLAPYPVRFAFNGATPGALLMIQNRSLLIQVRVEGAIKNILFNPTDGPANQATPFYARMLERTPALFARPFQPKENRVAEQLAELGLSCADIDVIAFDHFHTQDLRPLLGSGTTAPRFPNAYLLAPESEWLDWDELPQCQRAWFVADGKRDVPLSRVVLTRGDMWLGEGAVLLRTPGHTSGNQTLFVHAERGVFGSSENGTSADSWAPLSSRIPGVRRQAQAFDVDVIINSNTPELCGQQYISMMLERAMVDRVPERPELYQMFPSSEVTPHFVAPHIRPSYLFGKMESGQVVAAGLPTIAS
jgi:glyoxylase-like metal-dependent hydrolase (beta-lactamase superfamily II)